MKYLYTFVLPCLCSICFSLPGLQGQENSPLEWAPIGAKWWYMYNLGVGPGETTYTMEVVGDTIIQNISCRVLRQELADFQTGEFVHVIDDFIYQSGDTVFYYSRGLDEFSILYNFDALLFATFAILEPMYPYSEDSILLVTKQEQDSIIQDNHSIKRYYSYTDLNSSEWVLTGSIYEFIGNVDRFFLPLYDLGCDGGCPLMLRCYKDENFDIKFGTTPCDFITSATFSSTNEMTIYPNPATSYLFISPSESEIETIKIYNLTGQEQTIKYLGNQKIDISDFYPGAYWIHLKTRSQVLVTKLIVL